MLLNFSAQLTKFLGKGQFLRPGGLSGTGSLIKKHKGKARYLIIMDHDRFSRNRPEALMKIDELEDKHGIKVLATNEDVNLDTKDTAVFMQRAFNYLMANQELLRIRKRAKDGIRQTQSQGMHQPIISQADYWLAQEKMGLKRPSKTQPREDFRLRGVLKCWCGKSMTAGFSKGRRQYYLYYRCIEHTETNISGNMLHEKFEELLDEISFTGQQVDFITKQSKRLLDVALSDSKKILAARKSQVMEIDRKIEKLEVRLMEDEIDGATYKKWKQKFATERAVLQHDIDSTLNNEQTGKWNKLSRLLPQMTSIRTIYKAAPAHRKIMLIKHEAFKKLAMV